MQEQQQQQQPELSIKGVTVAIGGGHTVETFKECKPANTKGRHTQRARCYHILWNTQETMCTMSTLTECVRRCAKNTLRCLHKYSHFHSHTPICTDPSAYTHTEQISQPSALLKCFTKLQVPNNLWHFHVAGNGRQGRLGMNRRMKTQVSF